MPAIVVYLKSPLLDAVWPDGAEVVEKSDEPPAAANPVLPKIPVCGFACWLAPKRLVLA